MRAASPCWEDKRPATSCMYQARINTRGNISTTSRMQEWLQQLPRPDLGPEPGPGPEPQPQTIPRQVKTTRPRSVSAPTPPPTASPTPGVASKSPTKRFHHPNPLSQHPVQLEELPPPPFKIPQRKSSLQHGLRISQLTTPPTSTTCQQSDLVQGIQRIQLDHPVESRGTRQPKVSLYKDITNNNTQLHKDMEMADPQQLTTGSRSVSASKRHTVQFGEMLEDLKEHLPVEDVKKRDRSEVSRFSDCPRRVNEKTIFCMCRKTDHSLAIHNYRAPPP